MKILIADDDPVSRRILITNLKAWGHEIVSTANGSDALHALQQEDAPILAILDWMMPGLTGVEICRRLRTEGNETPIYIILLTSLNCKENLLEGLEAGADDYLTKPFDRHELRMRVQAGARIVGLQQNLRQRVRELEEAIVERERAEETLRSLSLTDHMTGLYNHRGFHNLAEHHARISRRSHTKSLLIYADMDGLKKINDTMGHHVGSQAITAVAEVLRSTFRDCDIIARLGGDEFAILAPNVPLKESRKLIERLRNNLVAYNKAGHHQFEVALSIGAVEIDHTYDFGLEDQMAKADAEMYRDKNERRAQSAQRT
ncbi:MAG TPA: diguanylate cyclase [Pyrinomonadaceae bacterium]|nr:diguanylate cyclase [Pyrinomonadaceae bacterium]